MVRIPPEQHWELAIQAAEKASVSKASVSIVSQAVN
jgi:hypothetical protein